MTPSELPTPFNALSGETKGYFSIGTTSGWEIEFTRFSRQGEFLAVEGGPASEYNPKLWPGVTFSGGHPDWAGNWSRFPRLLVRISEIAWLAETPEGVDYPA